jgi:hypothetical protein
MNSEKYIGLDVHQATISVAVLDHTGKLVMECILETNAATILEFFAGLRGTLSVTFEDGTSAAWLHDLLRPHVARLLVCNPRKNALLKQGNKSDRIDARKLAELLRGNHLKSVYHGETGVRSARTGTQLSNHHQGSDPGNDSAEGFVSQLGDSLSGKRRLLYSPSRSVVGKDPASGSTQASRTPLPSVGHDEGSAPASAAGTASGESKIPGHP